MKIKKISVFILIVLSIILVFLFVSCEKKNDSTINPSPDEQTQKTEDLTLSVVSADMIFGDELNIICFYGGDNSVEWVSSDKSVAVVDDDGTVNAVGVGSCDITAKAGSSSASCKVTVSMGDYLPELKVLHISDDGLNLRVGDEFEPEIKVLFNKVFYDCEVGFSVSDNNVVEYSNGKLLAKTEGDAVVTFTGSWLDFSSDKLIADIKINVKKNVIYNNSISIGGETISSSAVEISVTPEWQKKTYPNEAVISSSVTIDGTTYACEFFADGSLLDIKELEDGKARITANGIGNAILTSRYRHTDGNVYETEIPVEVYCPTEIYPEQFDFCPTDPVDVAEIFGTQYAKILFASQGDKILKTEFNYIEGVEAAGDDTEPMTILTNVGGFVFEDVFAYDVELNKDNIAEILQLGKGELKKDGYYILNSDITTETIDFTSQGKSVYNANAPQNDTYFCGTFDGRGYTLKAKVGQQGIFGGFYDGATIKNTKFVIEFSEKTESCGLAGNEGTFNLSGGSVVLNNLNVETVNYYKNSYALMGYCNFNLEMYDIYVNIKGTENLDYERDGIKSEMAALFHYDLTATMASNDSKFKGGFRNIFVVTGKFMPMACCLWPYGDYRYVSYAKNDESYLGDFRATGYSHIYTYCHVIAADNNQHKDKYFGTISYSRGENECKKYAWIFKAQEDIKDGGIERYDSVDELSKKTDKIGSWNVVG